VASTVAAATTATAPTTMTLTPASAGEDFLDDVSPMEAAESLRRFRDDMTVGSALT
jgi:hypothetical protein